jgi:hypothetical protein
MSSFTVAKAPVAAPKAFKGLSKAAPKPAPKVANVSKANEMMVWTPNNNKCVAASSFQRTCLAAGGRFPVAAAPLVNVSVLSNDDCLIVLCSTCEPCVVDSLCPSTGQRAPVEAPGQTNTQPQDASLQQTAMC